MSFWRKKKLGLLIALFIVLLLGIGSCYSGSNFRQSEHDVIVSSYPQGKNIYIDGAEDSISRTPTRLKLKESAKIEVEGFRERNVKEALKDGVIFFADSPLSIKERFDSYQYHQIIEDKENGSLSLEKEQERYVAYSYFWIGNLLEAKSILDEFIQEHLESLPCSAQAEVFMYLGYSNLNLGNKSKARQNFIKAFGCNLYLEHNQNAFWDKELGKAIIKEAKHQVQMRSKPLPLDLFVVVDVSKSIVEKQTEQINDLQTAVRHRLRPEDRVLFRHFREVTKTFKFLNQPPSSVPIVRFETINAEWTDFSALFNELHGNIDAHKKDENSSERQMAILIISDGEHSVKNNPGGFEERIPEDVSIAIEDLAASYKDIPIAIVTLDRVDENEKVRSGLEYENLWTEKLTGLCIGKSLYYKSPAKQQEILRDIFDIITPARDKVIVTRQSEGKNKKNEGNFFNANNVYTVKVEIRCTLPKAYLQVKCSADWTEEAEIQKQFTCAWTQTGETEGGPLVINASLEKSRRETVEITVKNPGEAFYGIHPREPKKFTLTFYQLPEQGGEQQKREVGTIFLLLQKEKPKIQITKLFGETLLFGETFIIQSGQPAYLKLKAKIGPLAHPKIIKAPEHPFKHPIYLTPKISKPDYMLTKETVSIPIDTTRNFSEQKFKLTMTVEEVNSIKGKKDSDNISIDFETSDDSGAYFIDDAAVKNIKFRVLHFIVYLLYQFSLFVWIPLSAAHLFIFYNLDKKQFKRLNKIFEMPKKFSKLKWKNMISLFLLVFFALFLISLSWISWRLLSFWGAILFSTLLPFILRKKTQSVFDIINGSFFILLLLSLYFWYSFSLFNWVLIFIIPSFIVGLITSLMLIKDKFNIFLRPLKWLIPIKWLISIFFRGINKS